MFVKLDARGRLSPEVQVAMLEVDRLIALEMPRLGNAIEAEENAELDRLGVKIETLSPETVAEGRSAFIEGIWKIGMQCRGDAAADLRAKAIAAGLAAAMAALADIVADYA